MIFHLTELSGKTLTLVVPAFALREPLADEASSGARSKIMTAFGDFFVRETPTEILKMTVRNERI